MTTDDRQAVLTLLKAREEAVLRGDAVAALAALAEDVVLYDFPPPLAYRGTEAHDAAGLRAWFDTWDGPVEVRLHHETMVIEGDLAVVYGFENMRGEKKGEGPLDQWSRITTVLGRTDDGWRIVHEHPSFPLMMDGSGRAATDLTP
ncbi:YybH family protein [Brucella sp. JSBI001]|uniref:YybH family protein n=1 Tax=Brucella sp. JSBI001 TaxID=2886044 RepID=UPI00223104F6|nr:nuclear transport factor 2 family protein [Brucella sp. JSBI001]UZD69383.1 nuclear transport factor 2 family protein [Brucella sp. JSBI001]